MSCEPASVPYSVNKVADGEHPHHGTGAEVSDVHSLSITNPLAIDFEIREELAREKDEDEREKAAVTTTSNTMEESCRPKTNKLKFRTCCEWAVIVTVIAVIWGLLTLPTIYYLTPQTPAASNNTSQCVSERYTGSVCMSALAARQKCVSDRCGSTEIYIRMSASQENLESQVSSLLDLLRLLNPSPECREEVGPFLCFYYFGLCDSSGELYLPSTGEYETITTQTCAREFQIAVGILGNASLPQCNTLLPSETDCNGVLCIDSECNGTFSEVGSGFGDSRGTNCTSRMVNDTMMEAGLLVPYEDQNDNSTESPLAMTITCREGFYLDNEIGFCLPECSKWENAPHHAELTTQVIAILGAVVYIVSASVLLLLSCLHHKRMFKFPSVFVVYEHFPLGLWEVFLLIAFTDRERLLCSKRDVVGSLEDSTPFCNIQGAVFHYIALQVTLLWLFHILSVFCGVKFPFRTKTFEKNGYFRHVHFIMLGIAIVVPCIPLAAVLGTGGSALGSFPPYQCFARSADVIYYTFILPASIMVGAGLTLLIVILNKIVHVTELWRNPVQEQDRTTEGSWCSKLYAHIKKVLKLHSGEVKVLVISCYFTIFAVFTITAFTVTNVQNQASFINNIATYIYFACEATGTLRQCDNPFVEVSENIAAILTFVLIGLFPIVNLIYVLNMRELKQKLSKHFSKSKQQLIRSSNGIVTPVVPPSSYLSSEF